MNSSSLGVESLQMEISSYRMMNIVCIGILFIFVRMLQTIYLHFKLIILLLLSPVLLCWNPMAAVFLRT